MFRLTGALGAPARERVVVLSGKCEHVRNGLRLAAPCDDLGARRLDIACLIPGAALQHSRAAIPAPRRAEACERLGVDRLLQCRLRPALATVGRYHDLRDPAV